MKRISNHIRNNFSVVAMVAAALGMVSCAGSSSAGGDSPESGQVLAMSEGEGTLALEKKFLMKKEDMAMTKEGMLAGGGKRSQFEGKKQVQFGGEWGEKNFEKQQYEKKSSWWRGKKAEVKSYEGGEDGSRFQTASRHATQSAKQSGQQSRFSNADARTGNYEVEAATESGRGNVRTQADARTEWRRDVYPEPVRIGQGEYEAQSIQKTRSLLGRDD